MAQIKKTPKPNQLPIGAKKDQVLAYDKDGNIISTGRTVNSYLPAINTAARGKYLKVKDNTNAAEWTDIPTELPEGESGDKGKVLFLNDQLEPQWGPFQESIEVTTVENITVSALRAFKIGNIAIIQGTFTNTGETEIAASTPIASIPVGYRPPINMTGLSSSGPGSCTLYTTGNLAFTSALAAGAVRNYSVIYAI